MSNIQLFTLKRFGAAALATTLIAIGLPSIAAAEGLYPAADTSADDVPAPRQNADGHTKPEAVGTGPQSAAVPSREQDVQSPPAPTSPRTAKTPEDFARFDALSEPGLAIVYPSSYDSILQDWGGWRSKLADYDISFTIRSTNIIVYDVLQNNRPATPQSYNGQKFTVQTASPFFSLAIGLDKIGISNTKILFSGIYYKTTWAPNGPTDLGIRQLAVYHSFANKKVEVKFGYQPNYIEFIGVLTGGSPLLTTGLSSLVPVQVGLSADPAGAPTFNLTVNGKNGLYFKGGVQRSASPLGQIYEVQHNGIGLDFGARRASALYIGEFGIRRPAADGARQIWLRTGFLYNSSDYSRFRDNHYANNWSLFALGDYQIVQRDAQTPYRGIFVGASAFYAPPAVNVYTQYYEGRIYTVGIFDSRPSDSITLNVNYSKFSPAARSTSFLEGIRSPRDQFQLSTSYSFHAARGVYLSPSVAYVHHPSFQGPYKDALNFGLNLFNQF